MKVDLISEQVLNRKSAEIFLTAKPDIQLFVLLRTPVHWKLILEPEYLIFTPTTTRQSFTVTSRRPGVHKIMYRLGGINAKNFDPIQDNDVYVVDSVSNKPPVNHTLTSFGKGCFKSLESHTCLNEREVSLISTCTFDPGTNGLVTVKSQNNNFPLSLVGVTSNTMQSFDYIDPSTEVREFLQDRVVTECSTSDSCCSIEYFRTDLVNYVLEHGYFQRVFLHSISKMLPSWLGLSVSDGPLLGAANLKAVLGNGLEITTNNICLKMNDIEAHDMYVIYEPNFPAILKFLSSSKSIPYNSDGICMAINLCRDAVHILLSKSNALDFTKDFADLGITSMRQLLLHQLHVFHASQRDCAPLKKIKFNSRGCLTTDMKLHIIGDLSLAATSSSISFDGVVHVEFTDFNEVCLSKFTDRCSVFLFMVYVILIDLLSLK